jgi:hypothetical protein
MDQYKPQRSLRKQRIRPADELALYEAGVNRLIDAGEHLGGDSPDLVDGHVAGLVWDYQWSHIAAVLLEGAR